MGKYFGTDGVRGVAYEFLNADLAEKIGSAFGSILLRLADSPRVVIGGDTRESYGMLLDSLTRGLTAMGAEVHVAGTVPTPAIAYLTAKCGFDGGIMISASHNPYEYNVIKILGSGGFKLSDSQCGCKAFRADAVKKIFPRCEVDRFAFDFEAILWAVKMNLKISEIPVHVINHGESKVNIVRDTFRMLRDLRKMKKRIRKAKI